MKIRTVIVDDESPAREELRYLLEQIGTVELCGEADCGEDAIKLVKKERPDLVFLDICLGDLDGLSVARELIACGCRALIVFVTAYNRFAVDAFELNAVDYILKPFAQERVEKTLARARELLEEKTAATSFMAGICRLVEQQFEGTQRKVKKLHKIPVYRDNILYLIEPDSILFASMEDGGVILYTGEGKYRFNWTLSELENRLENNLFYRTHRAFLVNLNKVTKVLPWFKGTCKLVMEGGTEVPVSRFYVKGLKEIMDIKDCLCKRDKHSM